MAGTTEETKDEKRTGPLSPEAFEMGVHSLCTQFPDIPEPIVRDRLRALNRENVCVSQFLTALAVRDLLDLRHHGGVLGASV